MLLYFWSVFSKRNGNSAELNNICYSSIRLSYLSASVVGLKTSLLKFKDFISSQFCRIICRWLIGTFLDTTSYLFPLICRQIQLDSWPISLFCHLLFKTPASDFTLELFLIFLEFSSRSVCVVRFIVPLLLRRKSMKEHSGGAVMRKLDPSGKLSRSNLSRRATNVSHTLGGWAHTAVNTICKHNWAVCGFV